MVDFCIKKKEISQILIDLSFGSTMMHMNYHLMSTYFVNYTWIILFHLLLLHHFILNKYDAFGVIVKVYCLHHEIVFISQPLKS